VEARGMDGPHATADAIARLEHRNVDAGIVEASRAREPRDTGAYDCYARGSEIRSTTAATTLFFAARAMSAWDTIPTQHSSLSTITTRRIWRSAIVRSTSAMSAFSGQRVTDRVITSLTRVV